MSSDDVCSDYFPVVIIGNGPSGLSLSYILSGYWPYYNNEIHPDKLLQNKLNWCGDDTIFRQNLESLSDGLTGRSSNPVAVLFDQLHHPDADLGSDNKSCLSWRYDSKKVVPHLVLGKHEAGGSWRSIHKDGHTLSYANWLELPGYSIREWLNRLMPLKETGNNERLHLGLVRHYYADYVEQTQIKQFMRCGTTVQSVRRYKHTRREFDENLTDSNSDLDDEFLDDIIDIGSRDLCAKKTFPLTSTGSSPESDSDDYLDLMNQIDDYDFDGQKNWVIDVTENANGRRISYQLFARYVVLATGVYDNPKFLNIPGEQLPFVFHRCPDFRSQRVNISCNSDAIASNGFDLPATDITFSSVENSYSSYTHSLPNSSSRTVFKESYLSSTSAMFSAVENGHSPHGQSLPNTNGHFQSNGYRLSENDTVFTELRNSCSQPIRSSHNSDRPILIIGSGLSAADAVLAALENHYNVRHVFIEETTDRKLIFNRIPLSAYPEYRQVFDLMKGLNSEDSARYMSFPCHKLTEIKSDGHCMLRNIKTGEEETVIASAVVILIGASPDLSYLGGNALPNALQNGESILYNRHSSITVDPYTYEVIGQTNLYAMGSLVGDNFVRFATGGALGIANSIVKKIDLI